MQWNDDVRLLLLGGLLLVPFTLAQAFCSGRKSNCVEVSELLPLRLAVAIAMAISLYLKIGRWGIPVLWPLRY